jgi:hypothetical protein
VNQPKFNPEGGLFRFKWGVGRIIMDSKIMPDIIPIWISGESFATTQVMEAERQGATRS